MIHGNTALISHGNKEGTVRSFSHKIISLNQLLAQSNQGVIQDKR